MGPYEIAMLVSSIVLILSSIALVVIILIQSNSAKGLSGAIAGGSETYFGKNKKNSIEKKLLIITIVVTIVFALVSLGVASFSKNIATQEKEYQTIYQEWLESIFGEGTTVNSDGSISIGGSSNTDTEDHTGHDHEHE